MTQVEEKSDRYTCCTQRSKQDNIAANVREKEIICSSKFSEQCLLLEYNELKDGNGCEHDNGADEIKSERGFWL